MELKKLINSINKIHVETKPIWGKMNSSQMLWHCKRFIIFYQNDKNYSPNFMTKTFGYFHMFFLRYVIRWDYDKYPKNTLTLKFFDPKRANGLDFRNEKRELIQRLKLVNDYNKSFIINPLHGKVTKEKFKEVVRGHTSYYLKQFGVL
tara:strand:- start:94 stop:537 length:444 start_codon:yes stop_codon:yes gene_type:complete